jgi:hypothetical protein
MLDESLRRLRLDRRLLDRRGWIARKDLESELAALPDAADKIAPVEEEAEGEGGRRPADTREGDEAR